MAPTSRIGVPVTKHGRFGAARAERPAGRLERDRERRRQARRRPDGAPGDDVAVPHDDRDAERRRGHQDRHGDVPAGREDRGRSFGGEDGGRLRHGDAEPDRVEDGVDVGLGRPQRARGQSAQGDAGRRDELRLEAAMATQPAQVGRVVAVSPGAE